MQVRGPLIQRCDRKVHTMISDIKLTQAHLESKILWHNGICKLLDKSIILVKLSCLRKSSFNRSIINLEYVLNSHI